jgi:putative nucleotidyltransferase with HDIG domain
MVLLASGVVVYRTLHPEPHFLLLENASHGTWGFPKGHLEEGEDLSAGAIRECEEETGHKPGLFSPFFKKRIEYSYTPSDTSDPVCKRTYYLLSSMDSGSIRLSKEHQSYVWEPRLKARARLQHDNLREVLDCAYAAVAREMGLSPCDLERARRLIHALAAPGEAWLKHSLKVGEVTKRIVRGVLDRYPELPVDPETVEAAAVLHDIGRSRDHGIGHPVAGMELLFEEGLGHLAKPCISHWLKGRKREALEKNPYFIPERLDVLYGRFDLDTITLSEKIIALADSLVQHDRLVPLKDRYEEARKRYGASPWMRENERISALFIQEIEDILGGSLYAFLGL